MTSFFLAGLMQGSRDGNDTADQSYRGDLRDLILAHRPQATIFDPGELMAQWLSADADELRRSHGELATASVLTRTRLAPPVNRLITTFHDLVGLAATADVCVAWLPGHEASMGTAVEMYAAHQAGRHVVAITEMRQNLAVLATATHIVPTLAAFAELLASGALDA
ncbi:hypothetical protein EV385_6464 [Krasilnikovia cinnamomea]|uniref:Nucleoside 2-deoxyribosyltransferase-like protein n=1 Tax=Krasilnikovia cinnamomea TaxID=349313 RepID=A0A4Q7ZV35_9ACTN|nr:hypothetical protein [Krasilnikovia cinnamomea]RZU54513.1 hypothetical protein EV385_6464 [Krasilnikovia cinnamomea]